MFFHVRDLELHAGRFDVELPPGEIDFTAGSGEAQGFRQAGPLKASGKVELVTGALGEIRVKGNLAVAMEADCDRCLEPAAIPLDSAFELYYRPVEEGYGEDVAIDEGEAQMGFYEGDGLELNDVLREFVLLSMPMQRLCRPDCQGMCPLCGQNRNRQQCNCQPEPVDDRWEALKSIRS